MIGSWSAVGAQPNPLGERGPSMMRPVDEGPPHVPSHSAKRSYDSEIPQGAGWCGWWFTNPDEVNHRRYSMKPCGRISSSLTHAEAGAWFGYTHDPCPEPVAWKSALATQPALYIVETGELRGSTSRLRARVGADLPSPCDQLQTELPPMLLPSSPLVAMLTTDALRPEVDHPALPLARSMPRLSQLFGSLTQAPR